MAGTMQANAIVRVDSRHLFLDGVIASPSLRAGLGGLVTEFSEPGLIILTGVHSGPARAAIAAHTEPPVASEVDWDDVIEFSGEGQGAGLAVHGIYETAADAFTSLPGTPLSTVRVRVSARGRDTAPDLAIDDPVEDYRVEWWPERQPREPACVKATSEASASWAYSLRRSSLSRPRPRLAT